MKNTEFGAWLKSNLEYGRKLVDSGIEGARSSRDTSLAAKPVSLVLSRSARHSWGPAMIGASIGILGAYLHRKQGHARAVALAYTLVGAAIGFGTGMAWGTRRLTGTVVRGAKKGIDAVRDEHWLQKHPITYA
ncbi:MAG: hypothetical protein ACE14M_04120 [Terriglobales bacterium]